MRRAGRHVAAPYRFETVDCGHWLQLEDPDAVNRLLLDWLAEQSRGSRLTERR